MSTDISTLKYIRFCGYPTPQIESKAEERLELQERCTAGIFNFYVCMHNIGKEQRHVCFISSDECRENGTHCQNTFPARADDPNGPNGLTRKQFKFCAVCSTMCGQGWFVYCFIKRYTRLVYRYRHFECQQPTKGPPGREWDINDEFPSAEECRALGNHCGPGNRQTVGDQEYCSRCNFVCD